MPVDLLDEPTAAAYLNTSPRHLQALRSRAAIPYVKLGRLIRYQRSALDHWIAERTVPTATDNNGVTS